MIRIDTLNKYIEKSGRSWQEIAQEIGGIPETVEAFAEKLPDLKADALEAIALALNMPASVAGFAFFAEPAQDPNSQNPDCITGAAEPDNYHDELLQIFDGLDVRAKHKLLQLAYDLQDNIGGRRDTGDAERRQQDDRRSTKAVSA